MTTHGLAGRRVLITGAGRGLGAATARVLAARGCRLALVSRSAWPLDALADTLADTGVDVARYAVDLTEGEAADLPKRVAKGSLGGLDALINCAATVTPLGRFGTIPASAWDRAFDVNFLAAVRLTRAALEVMPTDWGRILQISSGAARPPGILGASAYSVSKAALEAFTTTIATELAGTGITMNAIRPGTMETGMQERLRRASDDELPPHVRERYEALFCAGHLTGPRVSAEFVAAVMETDINGQVLDSRRPLANYLAEDWDADTGPEGDAFR